MVDVLSVAAEIIGEEKKKKIEEDRRR